jgi:putative hydrolase of the HAD superfamily
MDLNWALRAVFTGMQFMTIDTLIFDQGGVLVWTRWEKVTSAWAELRHTSPREVFDRMLEGDAYAPFMRGEFDREEFRNRMSSHLNIQQTPEEFDELWRSAIEPNPDIVPLIESLSDRYRMVIGSNTDELHQERGESVQPIIATFDDFLLSYELGVLKPDPEFFEKGLAKLGLSPNQCFFTDDRQNNVDSATSVGIQSARFETVDQLITELSALGVG